MDTYLAQRRDIIVGHFRNHGWFPSLDAPDYSIMNTEVPSGQVVRVSGTSTFYYTTNGSDPRLPGGGLNPAAIAVTTTNGPTGPRTLIKRGADWRYFDAGSEPPVSGQLTWRDPGYPDAAWSHGPAILGYAGSATVNPVATTTRRYVNGVSVPQVTTTYLRHTFNLTSTNGIPNLVAEILRDDGVVVYLNGTEISELPGEHEPGHNHLRCLLRQPGDLARPKHLLLPDGGGRPPAPGRERTPSRSNSTSAMRPAQTCILISR